MDGNSPSHSFRKRNEEEKEEEKEMVDSETNPPQFRSLICGLLYKKQSSQASSSQNLPPKSRPQTETTPHEVASSMSSSNDPSSSLEINQFSFGSDPSPKIFHETLLSDKENVPVEFSEESLTPSLIKQGPPVVDSTSLSSTLPNSSNEEQKHLSQEILIGGDIDSSSLPKTPALSSPLPPIEQTLSPTEGMAFLHGGYVPTTPVSPPIEQTPLQINEGMPLGGYIDSSPTPPVIPIEQILPSTEEGGSVEKTLFEGPIDSPLPATHVSPNVQTLPPTEETLLGGYIDSSSSLPVIPVSPTVQTLPPIEGVLLGGYIDSSSSLPVIPVSPNVQTLPPTEETLLGGYIDSSSSLPVIPVSPTVQTLPPTEETLLGGYIDSSSLPATPISPNVQTLPPIEGALLGGYVDSSSLPAIPVSPNVQTLPPTEETLLGGYIDSSSSLPATPISPNVQTLPPTEGALLGGYIDSSSSLPTTPVSPNVQTLPPTEGALIGGYVEYSSNSSLENTSPFFSDGSQQQQSSFNPFTSTSSQSGENEGIQNMEFVVPETISGGYLASSVGSDDLFDLPSQDQQQKSVLNETTGTDGVGSSKNGDMKSSLSPDCQITFESSESANFAGYVGFDDSGEKEGTDAYPHQPMGVAASSKMMSGLLNYDESMPSETQIEPSPFLQKNQDDSSHSNETSSMECEVFGGYIDASVVSSESGESLSSLSDVGAGIPEQGIREPMFHLSRSSGDFEEGKKKGSNPFVAEIGSSGLKDRGAPPVLPPADLSQHKGGAEGAPMSGYVHTSVETIQIDELSAKIEDLSLTGDYICSSMSLPIPEKKEEEETKNLPLFGSWQEYIDYGISEKQSLFISYNGGTVPLVPREILPVSWETETKFKAVDLAKESLREFVITKVVNVSWKLMSSGKTLSHEDDLLVIDQDLSFEDAEKCAHFLCGHSILRSVGICKITDDRARSLIYNSLCAMGQLKTVSLNCKEDLLESELMRKLGTILTLEILELPRDHINIRSIEQFISSGLSGAGQLKSLNVRGKIAASIEKKLKGTLIQKDIEFIRQPDGLVKFSQKWQDFERALQDPTNKKYSWIFDALNCGKVRFTEYMERQEALRKEKIAAGYVQELSDDETLQELAECDQFDGQGGVAPSPYFGDYSSSFAGASTSDGLHENLALDQDGKLTEKKKRGTGRGRGGKRGKKEPTTSISCELPGEPRVTRSGRVTRSSVRQGTASLSQGYLEEEEDFPWGQEPNLREISSFQKTSHSLESGFSGMDLDQSEEEEEVPQKGRGRGGAKGRGRGTRGGGRKKAASSRTVGPKKKPTPRSTSSKSNVKKASSSQEDGDEEKQQDVNALFREKIRALGVPEMSYDDLFIEKDPIGRGAFGVVRRGTWRGAQVAIKELFVHQFYSQDPMKFLNEFKREVEMMNRLGFHPNVLKISGVITSPNFCLVSPFCRYGSLEGFLQIGKKNEEISVRPEKLLVRMLRDAAAGLQHLHLENVIHRDIALRNILVGDQYSIYVTDFGMSRLVDQNAAYAHTRSSLGPVKNMAPEAVLKKQYSQYSDVWSFGVLLWQVETRRHPYDDLDALSVVVKRTSGELPPLAVPKWTKPEIESLIVRCFDMKPSSRPSMSQVYRELHTLYSLMDGPDY